MAEKCDNCGKYIETRTWLADPDRYAIVKEPVESMIGGRSLVDKILCSQCFDTGVNV